MTNEKFEKVADNYSEKFSYSPYYIALTELLEKYLGNARIVLEIGMADGIVPMAWDKVRRTLGHEDTIKYYGVDPVERMVHIAKKRAKEMKIEFLPSLGSIDDALESAQITNDSVIVDGLVISRVLHEIFIQHHWDYEKLFLDIQKILLSKSPKIVVLGVLNRVTDLTVEETTRFIQEQMKIIGHGHDPAKDYVDQAVLDVFMTENHYEIIDQEKVLQPLEGFDPSPWGTTITVYRRTD